MSTLITSLLPARDRPERISVNKSTIGAKGSSDGNLCTRIGKIFLTVAEEACSCILESRYKGFDPIVKNFGCQINALEVVTLLQANRLALCEEAVRMAAFIKEAKNLLSKPIPLEGSRCLETYFVEKAKIDMPVSSEMSRLLRARILCVVNRDIDKEGVAVPITDITLLCQKLGTKKAPQPAIKGALQSIVDGLQTEESMRAVAFIQNRSELLPNDERRDFLVRSLRCVRESSVKNSRLYESPIVSVPLLHNTETVFRTYRGVVCVKNKLLFCDRQIVDARPKKVFILLPEEKLVDVVGRSLEEPLIVVEGYIANDTDLRSRIMEVGFMNIVRANCARCPQYASLASKGPLDAPGAEDDVIRYKSDLYNDAYNVVKIDHIFASSIKEEQDDKAA